MALKVLTLLNLSLLVFYPISWSAPLMRAGLLPFFALDEISIFSGISTLWQEDILLALLIALFAIAAPIIKTLGLTLIHFRQAPAKLLNAFTILGKLAMADVFLIALYILLARGVGLGRVETAWGLWLFTACTLTSLGISLATAALVKRGALS
jgi:paraquat-inducible protein A